MKFGPASPADAIGGVTVHTLRQGSLVLKKGTTIGPAEVEALKKAGVREIVVVRLEEGDVSEDVAAASIAQDVMTKLPMGNNRPAASSSIATCRCSWPMASSRACAGAEKEASSSPVRWRPSWAAPIPQPIQQARPG